MDSPLSASPASEITVVLIKLDDEEINSIYYR